MTAPHPAPTPRRPRRPGFTIPEVLVALLLFGLLLTVAYTVLLSGSREQDFVSRYADLADQTRRAVRRLSRDVRTSRRIVRLEREGLSLRSLVLELTDPESPEGPGIEVRYDYEPGRHLLTRQGKPMLSGEIRDLEAHAFDDAGRLLTEEGAQNILSFLRLRFELGSEDDPPGRRRRFDLTLAPRVPTSRAKADRVLFERALERFGSQNPATDPVPGGGTVGRPRPPWQRN